MELQNEAQELCNGQIIHPFIFWTLPQLPHGEGEVKPWTRPDYCGIRAMLVLNLNQRFDPSVWPHLPSSNLAFSACRVVVPSGRAHLNVNTLCGPQLRNDLGFDAGGSSPREPAQPLTSTCGPDGVPQRPVEHRGYNNRTNPTEIERSRGAKGSGRRTAEPEVQRGQSETRCVRVRWEATISRHF